MSFLRADSVPLASERFGEPGRLRPFIFRGRFSSRPVGVFWPFVEEGAEVLVSFAFRASAAPGAEVWSLSSSLMSSSSSESESLFEGIVSLVQRFTAL